MKIKEEIKKRNSEFLALCKNHNVERLYAFGSSTNEKFNAQSDIDLLIEINELDPILRGEILLTIWDKFEYFFQRKVDLLTFSSLKNPILKQNIERSKILLYEGNEQEISI